MIGKHKNIINLLGACTQDGKQEEGGVFCPHTALLARRPHRETTGLQGFCSQGISRASIPIQHVVHTYPSTQEAETGGSQVWLQPGVHSKSVSKVQKSRGWEIAQSIESMFLKAEDLLNLYLKVSSYDPSTGKMEKGESQDSLSSSLAFSVSSWSARDPV